MLQMSFMGIIDHVKFNFMQSMSKSQPQAQAALCPRKDPGTHRTGSWMDHRTRLYVVPLLANKLQRTSLGILYTRLRIGQREGYSIM
jgi:hypothetical protein